MSNLNSRMARLEAQVALPPKVMIGFIDYDLAGRCCRVTLDGQDFHRIGDESEAALLGRAKEAVGPADTLLWVSWKRPRERAVDAAVPVN